MVATLSAPLAAPQDRQEQEERIAQGHWLLGDPLRLRILSLLCQRRLSGADIARQFGCARNTISKHLVLLAQAGLVTKDGQRYVVRLDTLTGLFEETRRYITQS